MTGNGATHSGRAMLWDLPTRVFHWLIVVLVALSWWSGEQGEFERHAWFGYTSLVLVVSRVVWGFIGSTHSRFADFVLGPGRVLSYLQGRSAAGPGHNPIGGWSVVCLLVLLLLQSISGLFNSDDLMFQAPFHFMASVGFRDAMGVVHKQAFNVLLGFIALHLLAVAFYQWRRRAPLIQAMLKGSAEGREGTGSPRPAWLALLVAVLVAGLLWWAISLAPQPQMMW